MGYAMSEPFRDDSWEQPTEPEPQYVDESLAEVPRSYFTALCEDCGTNTTHADFADEWGSSRISGCVVCRRVMERPDVQTHGTPARKLVSLRATGGGG